MLWGGAKGNATPVVLLLMTYNDDDDDDDGGGFSSFDAVVPAGTNHVPVGEPLAILVSGHWM